MIAALLAAAAAAFAPSSADQEQLSLRPFAQGLRPLTAIASTSAEPRRLYAVEQSGRIVYFVNGRLRGTFIDLRGRITSGGNLDAGSPRRIRAATRADSTPSNSP